MSDKITDIIKNIHSHIGYFAKQTVIARGRELYENESLDLDDYSKRSDHWSFSVYGSDIYRVSVKGIEKKKIRTSCTCPYDWGGACKHVVASLLYISAYYREGKGLNADAMIPASAQKINKVSEDSGFQIPDYRVIDFDFVKRKIYFQDRALIIFRSNFDYFNLLEIDGESLTFSTNDGIPTVQIYRKKSGKVYIRALNERRMSDSLSQSEALCLAMIAKSPMPNLLDEVFSGRVQTKQKEVLKDYGLPEDSVFNTYFSFSFTQENGLQYIPDKYGSGLLPVATGLEPKTSDLLKKLTDNAFSADEILRKQDAMEMGFVLVKFYDSPTGTFRIVPICGKTSKKDKTQLRSYIHEWDFRLEKQYLVQKSENAEKLLSLIRQIDEQGGDFQLMKQAFAYLLKEKYVYKLAEGAGKIRKTDLQPIELSPRPYDMVYEVRNDGEFLYLDLKVRLGDELFDRSEAFLEDGQSFIFEREGMCYFAKSQKVFELIKRFPRNVKMVASFKDKFFEDVVEPVAKNFEIVFRENSFEVAPVELDFNKKQVFLSEEDSYVIFSPRVEYDNNVSALLRTTGNILHKEGDRITEYRRNYELEDDFLESLASLHPEFERQKDRKVFYLHYTEFTKDFWFYRFFDQLQADNVEVFGLKDLKNFRYSPHRGKISTSVTSGQDWFEVDVSMGFGDMKVKLEDIRQAVVNKQRYILLKDGSAGILPSEWLHKLERYFRNGDIKDDKIAISKLRFSVIDDLFDSLDDAKVLQEIAEKRESLRKFRGIENSLVPKKIRATLRDYQKEGLNWLNFLDQMQWGGILADDMGLGKTLQILSFLQQQADQKKGTSLVVVPTSLLFNWQNELKKFAPKLRAFYYYGGDRERNTEAFTNYDLIFTTYGILLRDVQLLAEFPFHYAILDESQAIKNPASRRYKAACLIKAGNKIALTGTPIENSTFDLFAQMSFVNRGFFGAAKNFKTNYSTPVDRDGDAAISAELNKIINPFVLRRTKENVASELPDKTENILYCEMGSEQRRVYDAYRNEYRSRLLDKIDSEGIGKSKMMVLEALTRLRQICDSPSLLKEEDIPHTPSVKIEELVQHITDKTGRHKILVFSQFVQMLDLIRSELSRLNIEYEYLDGKSRPAQREKSVQQFQENENLRVFLISLKAGGTGLNLTAADYVYLVDPWWNPAVENQAIDRCHRIGQDKKVFAYRMICKNTVEEKILSLQSKKKKIAGDIIQSDESILQKLNEKDIQELFS